MMHWSQRHFLSRIISESKVNRSYFLHGLPTKSSPSHDYANRTAYKSIITVGEVFLREYITNSQVWFVLQRHAPYHFLWVSVPTLASSLITILALYMGDMESVRCCFVVSILKLLYSKDMRDACREHSHTKCHCSQYTRRDTAHDRLRTSYKFVVRTMLNVSRLVSVRYFVFHLTATTLTIVMVIIFDRMRQCQVEMKSDWLSSIVLLVRKDNSKEGKYASTTASLTFLFSVEPKYQAVRHFRQRESSGR